MTEISKNLNLNTKETLLNFIFQYFTEKGYLFFVGTTTEPEKSFKIEGKPFVPKLKAIILKSNEDFPKEYTDIKSCKSLEEILVLGKDIRNELIYFTLDLLVDD